MLKKRVLLPVAAASVLLGTLAPVTSVLTGPISTVYAAETAYQTQINTVAKNYADFLRQQETNMNYIENLEDEQQIITAFEEALAQTDLFLDANENDLVGVHPTVAEIDGWLYEVAISLYDLYDIHLAYLNGDIDEEEADSLVEETNASLNEIDVEVYKNVISYKKAFSVQINNDLKYLLDLDENQTVNTYVVKSGDTITKVSAKFGMKPADLKEINRLTSDVLQLNSTIFVYGTEIAPAPVSNVYTVKNGDTLYKIARLNNMTVSELKQINGLKSEILKVGQVLKLVKTTSPVVNAPGLYVVKKGDTLSAIAKANKTTVTQLKEINNLKSDSLKIGQTIKLFVTTHIVKKGETLYSVAKKYNTTVSSLKTLNNLESDSLKEGQTLRVK